MNVYTFYHQDPTMPDFTPLIELWKRSWSKHGFTPVVLTMADAEKHPQFKAVKANVESLPTVNPKQYTVNDFLRWLAVDALGSGVHLHTDADVINYGFKPNGTMAEKWLRRDNPPIGLYNTHTDGQGKVTVCPCVVEWPTSDRSLTSDQFIHMMEVSQATRLEFNKPHASDQLFFNIVLRENRIFKGKGMHFMNFRDVVTCGQDGWEKADLVHYATSPITALYGKIPKPEYADLIQRIRPI